MSDNKQPISHPYNNQSVQQYYNQNAPQNQNIPSHPIIILTTPNNDPSQFRPPYDQNQQQRLQGNKHFCIIKIVL